MEISVVIPAHNPNPDRLSRTLQGLREQQLPEKGFEIILVDNASTPALGVEGLKADLPSNLRIAREPRLGLSHARARGFTEARGSIIVLVDDDNVLEPEYLARASSFLQEHPEVGAVGGKVLPEYEQQPALEILEFSPLLALRDLGDSIRIATGFRRDQAPEYPLFAPIGAGMALRAEAAKVWVERMNRTLNGLPDRRGKELSSAGDNDIVLSMMAAGYGVAYLPSLVLTHLIPAQRVQPDYLERLNFGIQKSWMQVLAVHGASPWPPLSPLGARLRQARAWFRMKPWRSDAHRIRFAGACGHFEGRVANP